MLRSIVRQYLKFISKRVLSKHGADVVAVIGDGPNAVIRELSFQLINIMYPARQNSESPEAEFSVPLTILGVKGYPMNWYQWVKTLVKVCLQLFTIKPYRHFLILELDTINSKTREFWLNNINPDYILLTSEVETILAPNANVFRIESDEREIIEAKLSEFGEEIEIEAAISESIISQVQLPVARLNFHPGLNGSLVIDATHYYYPTALDSVIEAVEAEQDLSHRIIITTLKSDLSSSQLDNWEVNPENLELTHDTVLVLRGYAPLVRAKYNNVLVDRKFGA